LLEQKPYLLVQRAVFTAGKVGAPTASRITSVPESSGRDGRAKRWPTPAHPQGRASHGDNANNSAHNERQGLAPDTKGLIGFVPTNSVD